MSQTQLETELKTLIVESLMLETTPDSIDSNAPLFVQGLGLDSIDALELSIAIDKKYNIRIKADDEKNKQIFSNITSLAAYIQDAQRQG